MAGICFWIFMFPIDAIKSRIQVFQPKSNAFQYALQTIRTEGRIEQMKKKCSLIF